MLLAGAAACLAWRLPRQHLALFLANPPPRGGIAIFDSMTDFIKVHIEPHPGNKTIITYQDGEQDLYGN